MRVPRSVRVSRHVQVKSTSTRATTAPLPLAQYTTLRCGGSAQCVLSCTSVRQLKLIIAECRREGKPWVLLGSGSNALFLDPVYNGTVIINHIKSRSVVHASSSCNNGAALCTPGTTHSYLGHTPAVANKLHAAITLRVGSGYGLAQLALSTANNGWAGLEEFCGIPGTIGGAVSCNSGSHGREMCAAVRRIHFLDTHTLQEFACRPEALQWGYRDLKAPGIITGVTVDLQADARAAPRVREYLARRRSSQPLHKPSAGCIFKNPPGGPSAGALLEMSGLKGHRIGGASVAQKHANFFLNEDMAATPTDFMALIDHARQRVWQDHAVKLDLEIRIIRNQNCDR